MFCSDNVNSQKPSEVHSGSKPRKGSDVEFVVSQVPETKSNQFSLYNCFSTALVENGNDYLLDIDTYLLCV